MQHRAYGISSQMHEDNWSSCKVSWRVPTNPVMLRSMVCSVCCYSAASLPPARLACCPLPLLEKMGISRTPPVPLSLCSQTLLEHTVRVYVGAKEDPKREWRHQSTSVRACSDLVDLIVYGPM